MCNFIYLAAIGLLVFYADDVLSQFGLAVGGAQDGPMVVAAGWEMALTLWPLVALGAVVGSALTLVVTRRRRCTMRGCNSAGDVRAE